jgi:hypothetical protein
MENKISNFMGHAAFISQKLTIEKLAFFKDLLLYKISGLYIRLF